jgi:hypothetical protein
MERKASFHSSQNFWGNWGSQGKISLLYKKCSFYCYDATNGFTTWYPWKLTPLPSFWDNSLLHCSLHIGVSTVTVCRASPWVNWRTLKQTRVAPRSPSGWLPWEYAHIWDAYPSPIKETTRGGTAHATAPTTILADVFVRDLPPSTWVYWSVYDIMLT